MLRNALILLVLLVWFVAVVGFALAASVGRRGAAPVAGRSVRGGRTQRHQGVTVMYHCTIEIEPDADGFHAVVIGQDNSIAHVTNTFPCPDDAEYAARQWINDYRLSA